MRKDNVSAQVLVVDDDPLTCELIREILCSAGMEAASLTDSTEAASRLRTEKFHAIFLDVRMPPPDGIELARQIRASRVNAYAAARDRGAKFGHGRSAGKRVESADDPNAEKEINVGEPLRDVARRAHDSGGDGVADGSRDSKPHAKNFEEVAASARGG